MQGDQGGKVENEDCIFNIFFSSCPLSSASVSVPLPPTVSRERG